MKSPPTLHSGLPDTGVHGALVAALQTSKLVVGLYDPQDVLRWANPAFGHTYLRGLAPPVHFADILRHGWRQGFGVQIDCGDVEHLLGEILPRRRSRPARAFAADLVGGRWLWVSETLLPDGWLLSVASDITALKAREFSLQRAHEDVLAVARTDALTGVASRGHVLELGEAALQACAAQGRPFSLALIDLDHFKQINDTHGHARGDEVLRRFGALCLTQLRHPGDALGRFGGEEFLLLLPGAPLAAAEAVLARLRDGLRAAPDFPHTFSAGFAQAGASETLDAAIKRADQALYRAKRLGRDRSVAAEPPRAP